MDYSRQFEELKSKNLSLDLTRGKPSADQLDLSNELADIQVNYLETEGIDLRNYGEIKGLESCRELGARILGCSADFVWAGGNSSLALMAQYLTFLFAEGNGSGPWNGKERTSVLCPVPGYDRHFNLCESFGINMIPVPLTGQGPDLNNVQELVDSDKSIKGIWCVPKYSNPTGEIYSYETISGLLEIFGKADNNSVIFWDNAYAVHDFSQPYKLDDIFEIAQEKGYLDTIVEFGSTSKITYAGAGISFIAMSKGNQEKFLPFYSSLMIGPDKLNQAKHVKFFQERDINDHMRLHAEIIGSKFKLVRESLQSLGLGSWTDPQGGYFLLFETKAGLAKQVISLAAELGLRLTPAGSTHPYGIDTEDKYIRLAPTACSLDELSQAMEVFTCCVGLAYAQAKQS